MAVDTAVGRPGGPDAGAQEDDIFFGITPAQELIDQNFFQFKHLIDGRRLLQGDLVLKTVDDDHQAFVGLSGDFQGIETGILEVGPEVSPEIGDARQVRDRRKGDGHAFAGSGEVRNAPQRPGRQDQRVFRIIGRGLKRNPPMQKIQTQAPAADEEVPYLGIERVDAYSAGAHIYI